MLWDASRVGKMQSSDAEIGHPDRFRQTVRRQAPFHLYAETIVAKKNIAYSRYKNPAAHPIYF